MSVAEADSGSACVLNSAINEQQSGRLRAGRESRLRIGSTLWVSLRVRTKIVSCGAAFRVVIDTASSGCSAAGSRCHRHVHGHLNLAIC